MVTPRYVDGTVDRRLLGSVQVAVPLGMVLARELARVTGMPHSLRVGLGEALLDPPLRSVVVGPGAAFPSYGRCRVVARLEAADLGHAGAGSLASSGRGGVISIEFEPLRPTLAPRSFEGGFGVVSESSDRGAWRSGAALVRSMVRYVESLRLLA